MRVKTALRRCAVLTRPARSRVLAIAGATRPTTAERDDVVIGLADGVRRHTERIWAVLRDGLLSLR